MARAFLPISLTLNPVPMLYSNGQRHNLGRDPLTAVEVRRLHKKFEPSEK